MKKFPDLSVETAQGMVTLTSKELKHSHGKLHSASVMRAGATLTTGMVYETTHGNWCFIYGVGDSVLDAPTHGPYESLHEARVTLLRMVAGEHEPPKRVSFLYERSGTRYAAKLEDQPHGHIQWDEKRLRWTYCEGSVEIAVFPDLEFAKGYVTARLEAMHLGKHQPIALDDLIADAEVMANLAEDIDHEITDLIGWKRD